MNIMSGHMDNVSFLFKTKFQKWKYSLQRNIDVEGTLGEETLTCKEIMKVDDPMETVIGDGPSYEKLVKKLRKV